MIRIRLKEIRENNDMSQRSLREVLKVGKSTYSRWETGEQLIPLTRLNEFCNYFHVSMDYALGISKTDFKTKEIKQLDKNKIGQNLKSIRKELNYTQEELAKLFNTTHSTISAYENGKTIILTAFAIELCKRYGYSLDWICNKR
jgi:transcriptional regulator with XRE-family HTH domain